MGIDELDARRREAEVAPPGAIGRVAVEPPQRAERPAWQVERVSGPDAAKDGRTYTFRLTRADTEARLVRVWVPDHTHAFGRMPLANGGAWPAARLIAEVEDPPSEWAVWPDSVRAEGYELR
jgi:hypothetical protein